MTSQWAWTTPLHQAAFTLIELSIVLVIIGFLVGGALLGKDLIKAAEIRAQISQITEYNTAMNLFKLQYNSLPGDLPPSEASAVGFSNSNPFAGTRNGSLGAGNNNGKIEDTTGIDWLGSVEKFLTNMC